MHIESSQKKYLTVFQLVMMAVISVDSLRNLPIAAQYGFSLVFFYLAAGLLFFLPLAWVTSRLAVQYPKLGGSYVWVEAAFGKRFGYLSVFLLWVYNLIWYPTIFAFISSIIATLLFPAWASNKWFILISCQLLFWSVTFLNFYGIRVSALISLIGAILGTLFPMFLIMCLAIYWLASGSPSAVPFNWHSFFPNLEMTQDLAYFSNFLFSLLGLEVIAVHASNVYAPEKTYPKTLLISAPLILFTLTFSALALCIVIEPKEIKLISGVMDVFNLFFKNFPWGSTMIAGCIVLGGVGIASSWIIGPARALQVALSTTTLPRWLSQLNAKGSPTGILWLQGSLYTLLLSAFLIFPTINSSYWLLSALTAQFALLYYVLLFSAAIYLFRQKKHSKVNTFFNYLLPILAACMSIIGIMVGFIPPSDIAIEHRFIYKLFMGISLFIFCLLPILLLKTKKKLPII